MIKVFGITDKIFASNGDVVLRPLKAKIRKEDNGDFFLTLETGIEYADFIASGNIVVANTPSGDQPFRISNVTKTRTRITAKAYHVFYDSKNYVIEDSYVVAKNCNDALDHLNSATDETSPFTTISDITTINSFRCVRKSLFEAVFTVIERWGGHLVRDNFDIGVRESIGMDNGVVVRYRKNLKEITVEENWNDVCTKVLPVGKDGLLLPEIYLESSTQYDIPYTKTVTFSQDLDPDDYSSDTEYMNALETDLRTQAQEYLDRSYLPSLNYSLSANLEKITDIGDTVHVIDERLGINIETHVIAYEYDCILEKYTLVEFGNFKKTLQTFMETISAEINKTVKTEGDTIRVVLTEELEEATAKIWNALGNSYVIYDGDKILVVDRLPKEEARYCIMINSGGIGFSSTGIDGVFNSAWTIDGTLNMQAINVINMTADLIKGGTLKLGNLRNKSGKLEVYDEQNNLIGLMDKDGLKMYGLDGSYVLMNNEVGFSGYDRNDNRLYWCDTDEFHMRKSVVEEEITLCNQLRFIRIKIENQYGTAINDGIGLVSSYTEGT